LQKIRTHNSETDYYTNLLNEVGLQKKDLIFPVVVKETSEKVIGIKAIPGIRKISLQNLSQHVRSIIDLGISSIIIFGIPEHRDRRASSAVSKDGIVQRTIRKIKKEFGGLLNIVTDVCICQYNLSGHCGLVISRNNNNRIVDNDSTLELLSKIAISHAESGADVIAPSSMMDGQVYSIRNSLESKGFKDIKIMSYAAKYASALYLPFRITAFSNKINNYSSIDKSGYQIGYSNPREVIREVQADIQEGGDMIVIKPGIGYLDVVSMIKEVFSFPTAVQNVSGEYAMIKAAARNGWIDEEEWKVNSIAAIKRAGADNIISYFSMDIAGYLDH
jgi:porphobilinogen synthase